MQVSDFTAGQEVYCFSFGSWYKGTVAKLGRTRIQVTYTTGTGTTRTVPFSLDKISVEKKEPGRGPARRSGAVQHIQEPVMMERTTQLTTVQSIRLLSAFQALTMKSGFFGRGVTHKVARDVIEQMIGIRLKVSAKPVRSRSGLEGYIEWASQPEVQIAQDPGLRLIQGGVG